MTVESLLLLLLLLICCCLVGRSSTPTRIRVWVVVAARRTPARVLVGTITSQHTCGPTRARGAGNSPTVEDIVSSVALANFNLEDFRFNRTSNAQVLGDKLPWAGLACIFGD